MEVQKRDKSIEPFQFEKIENAIGRAFASCGEKMSQDVINCIRSTYDESSDEVVHVEDIQDSVERCLMATHPDVAKHYIIYRYNHKLVRENKEKLMKGLSKKLMAQEVENQNANVDERSFGGRVGEASRLVTKQYALDYCMSRKSRRNHVNNEIYIHDLDSYAVGNHNCLTMPLDDLLANGFNVRQCDVRPAKSINTAFQLVAVLFQIQSLQQFGGVSASHIDWTMVPYVRRSLYKHYILEFVKTQGDFEKLGLDTMSIDELDEWIDKCKDNYLGQFNLTVDDFYVGSDKLNKDLYQRALLETRLELNQAVEGMYHNLNTLQSRSGNQLPFSSLNYGTCTLPEGRMVTRAILEGSIKGVGKHRRTPIFPCGIFQSMKGVNRVEGDPNYDLFRLALKSTSQRLYPNYVNVDWSGNKGYDINDPKTYMSTMGCRTVNGLDINGLGQLKDGRGNIAPVTIIMPTLAMQAKKKITNIMDENSEGYKTALIEEFFKILSKKIGEARDMLIERFEWICSQSPESAKFMWENNTMAGYIPEEGIRSALRHGTLVIGNIALAETLQILIGKNHTTDEGMEIAKRIYALFNKKTKAYKEKYKLNFGVYNTPAENLVYTAMQKFKAEYGIIKNVSDRKYFTNSMHVPVWEEMTPFEKIDIESQLTGYSNAGCITYVELPSTTKHNIDALEKITLYSMEKDIPYLAFNIPVDDCDDCGYSDEMGEACPVCGGTHIRRLRRVTGYLTGDYKTAFNLGKQDEVEDRVKHVKEF